MNDYDLNKRQQFWTMTSHFHSRTNHWLQISSKYKSVVQYFQPIGSQKLKLNIAISLSRSYLHLTLSIPSHTIWEINDGVSLGPTLLYISMTNLDIEVTCKEINKSFKNFARFQDFKLLRNWNFASPCLTVIDIIRSLF